MKKSIAIILSIILILAFTLPAAAISSIAVKSINLNTSKTTLKIGETYQLKASLTPANTTQKLLTYVTWNQKVAAVDKTGKITGVSAGTATIVVYTPNKKIFAKCNVTVSQPAKELRITTRSWIPGKYKLEAGAKQFEKDHPGIKVTINKIDNIDVTSYILQWSQGKTNCDLALGGSREQIVPYVAKDYLIDFEKDFFDEKVKKEDFIPSFFQLGNIEGTQYMIPFCGEVMFVCVNKTLMKKAGLVDDKGNITPPKTWDELYEYAKKATIVENGKVVQFGLGIDWDPGFMAYSYLSSLQGVRGNIYSDDKISIDFKSKEAKNLLTVWRKLVAEGYSPTSTFTDSEANRSAFKSGTMAMQISAASRWTEATALLGSNNVTIMPIPGTDTNGSLVYIHGAYIPKVSPAQGLAKQFIKEVLLNKDFQTYSMNLYGKMPPIRSPYENALFPQFNIVMSAANKAATNPLYKEFPKLDTAIQIEIQKALTGKQTVDEALANLDKVVSTIDKSSGVK